MTKRILPLLALALIGCTAPTNSIAQGTVVYHNEGDIRIFSDGGFRTEDDLDLDGNGTVDFKLVAQFGFWMEPAGVNETIATRLGGGDLTRYVNPLAEGVAISSTALAPAEWIGAEEFFFPQGGSAIIYPFFHGRSTSGTSGPWRDGVDAYIGVSFLIDDETHYGWINLEIPDTFPFVLLNGGIIKDWAYNTVPGEMILAGQVPEPSTWALLIGGGAVLFWRCRRR